MNWLVINIFLVKCAESAATVRKDSAPPSDGQTGHDLSGSGYSQEQIGHDALPSSTMIQSKDDAGNPEQVATSFGDMNISVQAVSN